MKGARGWTSKSRAPTDLAITSASVAADASIGDTVGTLSASDIDGGPLTYTLTNDAGGAFEIVGTALKVADTLSAGTVNVNVRVTDEGGNELDAIITITVTGGGGGGLLMLGSEQLTLGGDDLTLGA